MDVFREMSFSSRTVIAASASAAVSLPAVSWNAPASRVSVTVSLTPSVVPPRWTSASGDRNPALPKLHPEAVVVVPLTVTFIFISPQLTRSSLKVRTSFVRSSEVFAGLVKVLISVGLTPSTRWAPCGVTRGLSILWSESMSVEVPVV